MSVRGKAMKIAVATLAAVLLSCGAQAAGQRIDLSAWTCKQFAAASNDSSAGRDSDVRTILLWLDGYYRTEDDPPVIDMDQVMATGKKLQAYCAAHPDTPLITAADMLLERE
jgi:acid stress chaperone HdeB